MKRIGLLFGTAVLICLICITSTAFADGGKVLTLRASYFSPNDAKAGFTFGGSIGTMFDKFVELGIGTDVYVRTYEKTTKVAEQSYEAGIDTDTYLTEVRYVTVIVPVMLELVIKVPIIWTGSVFAHGGIGYEVLFSKEQNFMDDVSDRRLYGGFGWMLGTGVRFGLGESSALFAEGFYHSAKVKRPRKDIKEALPVFEQVDLSGLGVRVGVAIGPM